MNENTVKNIMIAFKKPALIVKAEEDSLKFSNGWTLTGSHGQDCCERVYIDFSNSEIEKAIDQSRIFMGIVIRFIEGTGFILNNMLINCYNDQNGHYSDGLELKLHNDKNDETISIDITRFKEDV